MAVNKRGKAGQKLLCATARCSSACCQPQKQGCHITMVANVNKHFVELTLSKLKSHAAVSLSGSCGDAACDLDAASFSSEPLYLLIEQYGSLLT